MYESALETGDHFGEFRLWVERLPLTERIPFPYGFRDLRYNSEKSVIGIVSGVGTARAAASIMALGMDPRFDFTRAYWLVAGIAGVNPLEASIGSAAWAEWVVDVIWPSRSTRARFRPSGRPVIDRWQMRWRAGQATCRQAAGCLGQLKRIVVPMPSGSDIPRYA